MNTKMNAKTRRAKKIYENTNRRLRALRLPFFLHTWEQEIMPPAGKAYRNGQLVELSAMAYEYQTGKRYTESIRVLYEDRASLGEVLCHEIEEARKSADKFAKIPKEEYLAFENLILEAYPKFVEAKNSGSFAPVKPYLRDILAYKRKYVVWEETDALKGYDILLDEFEEGMTVQKYDEFFSLIKRELVPFLKEVLAAQKPVHPAFAERTFPVEKQKKFCEYLGHVMLFDKNKTMMGESEHPYTNNNGNCDVRITNHYYEHDLASAIFSAIHEMGHALYELQVSDELNDTMSGGGVSMAMHESQSRFFENIVGRSRPFWERHYPVLRSIFSEELADVSLDDFLHYINHVSAGFVRTEADELTYPLHVLIRYEIEKGMMDGTVSEENVEAVWNAKYKEYLGVDVPHAGLGVAQDMHWYSGELGYFPTYALGSAYGAQMLAAMKRDFDAEAAMGDETLEKIAVWLGERIHNYGASKSPAVIFENACGAPFDARCYVDYLKEKYAALVGVGQNKPED